MIREANNGLVPSMMSKLIPSATTILELVYSISRRSKYLQSL
jgi:hypothetical protein